MFPFDFLVQLLGNLNQFERELGIPAGSPYLNPDRDILRDMRFGGGCEDCGLLYYGSCTLPKARSFRMGHSPSEVAALKIAFDRRAQSHIIERRKQKAKETFLEFLQEPEIQIALNQIIERYLSQKKEIRDNARWYRRWQRWIRENVESLQAFWLGWRAYPVIDSLIVGDMLKHGLTAFSNEEAISLSENLEDGVQPGWIVRQKLFGFRSVRNLFKLKIDEINARVEEEKQRILNLIEQYGPVMLRWLHTTKSSNKTIAMLNGLPYKDFIIVFREVTFSYWEQIILRNSQGKRLNEFQSRILKNIPYSNQLEIINQLKTNGKIPA